VRFLQGLSVEWDESVTAVQRGDGVKRNIRYIEVLYWVMAMSAMAGFPIFALIFVMLA
jgi:hypothetical protein